MNKEEKKIAIIRFVIGVIIIGLGFYFQSWWGLIGLVPLMTAFFGDNFAYKPPRLTVRKEKKEKENKNSK